MKKNFKDNFNLNSLFRTSGKEKFLKLIQN